MRVALAVAAIGLVACSDLQFVTPGVVAPSLGIFVGARYDSQAHVILSARMLKGRDADGHPAVFRDSAIYVNGQKISPSFVEEAPVVPWFAYHWSVDHPATATVDTLVVIGPQLSEAVSPFQVVIRIPTRTDPRNLTLAAGLDLRLHVTPAAVDGITAVATQNWQLTLRPNCQNGTTFLQLFALGAYPAELRVPFEQLPPRPTDVEACFQAFAVYTLTQVPYYPTSVNVSTIAEWTIQLQP